MNRSAPGFPSPEEGLGLHLRLCEEDATAPADVCAAYLSALADWLAARSPKVDPHLRQTAAAEAVLKYVQSPQRYDPQRLDLGAYLRMAAHRDLANLLRSEARHHKHRVAWSDVEDGKEGGNLSGKEEEPSLRLARDEEAEECQALLRSVRDRCTPEEGRVLDLLLAEERSTGAYAEAIGVTALPAEEQAREVKRVKDRILKRLDRGGKKHG